MDAPAERFDRNLEDVQKADFKIKAKQFVKVYGQMASIIDFQVLQWDQLYWFLKFLIPKLRVPQGMEGFDDILDSVDLSTYGLERTRLDQPILLDEEGSEVDPQNPNPRSVHTGGDEEEELDLIIRSFNEKYSADLGGNSRDQRVKLISYAHAIRDHSDFEAKVANNPDAMTSNLAFKKIVDEVMARQRRQDIEWYKLFAKDEAFASSLLGALRWMVQ